MPQSISTKIRGLYTHDNDISSVPEGALSVADEVVIDRESVAEPRRGFARLSTGFSDPSYRANKLFVYEDKLLAHYSDNLLAYYDNNWTQYSGTYDPPSDTTPVRAAQSNQNFYYTTAAGVKKLDAYDGTPRLAGAYKALDLQASIPSTPTAAWLTDAFRVAYRAVWGYKDANNNLVLGAPSQRESVKNSSGALSDVRVGVGVPEGVTTAWFYQLYRSASVDNTGADTEPNDELGLVYEGNPTASQLQGYSKSFVDGDVDTTTDTITITAHGYSDGDSAFVGNTGGAVPTGLTAGAVYYVVNSTTDTLQLATSPDGTAIDITTAAGGGTHSLSAAGVISVLDITPDSLRGATIYTAASQEGLAAGNEAPPLAKDLAIFKNVLFYANTTSKHRYYLTLLGTGAPKGLQSGDTIVIGGVTYTAAASESIPDAEFELSTGGSAAQDIRDTMLSLVRVINRHQASTVVAYYLSGPDDLPGKILLEEESIGGSAFTVQSANATAWSPNITSAKSSTNDNFKNGLFYSKTNQPEAVPLTNFFFVGAEDKEILRILPLRDSLFILKEDGIFRLTGYGSGSFQVDQFDATTRLIAPESAVVLNNQIFALTDQGVVSISEAGVKVRSRPIESTLLALQGVDLDALRNITFAVSYESERKYILFVPRLAGDTSPTQAFVFNTFTNAWTRWVLSKRCGVVNPTDDKLYLGDATSQYVNQERKSFSYRDHVDYGSTVAITAADGREVTLTSTSGVAAGDILYQSDSIYSIVESVNTTTGVVTVVFTAAFTVGSVDVLKAIQSKIAWVPFTLGNPAFLKQFREATVLFKKDFTGSASLVFTSDVSAAEEAETLTGRSIGNWGLFAWGSVPWGGNNTRRPIRIYVPRNKQRASQLSVEFRHATGYAQYQLTGLSLVANTISERVSK